MNPKELTKLIRRDPRYHQWRRIVLANSMLCSRCGSDMNLQVHHRTPLGKLIKQYDIQDFEQAMSTPELWLIENGQTLCYKCHKQVTKFNI